MVFTIDIFMSFITGIYSKGTVVLSKPKIARLYLRSWFLVDLLACLPLILIFE